MLNTVLDSLDGLDEATTKLYTQKDDKFILQIEGIDNHPDVANLKNAYEREKVKRQEIATERDAFKAKAEGFPEDFDPKVWDKAKNGKSDEAELIKLRSELEQKITEASQRADLAESKLCRFAVERDLSDALIEAGITDPGLSKGARAMLAGQVKTSDEGKAIVESDMGPLALGDYVKKWAASEGKAFVTPPKGGGRNGNDGPGAKSKKWSEMTSSEKVALNKENPEEYERVKAAG